MTIGAPSAVLVLLAGALSALSPCILPVLPGFLAFLAGTHARDLASGRPHLLRRVLAFCLGLIVTFVALGALSGQLGSSLFAWRMWFERFAGLAFILWGFAFLGLVRLPALLTPKHRRIGGSVGALFFGLVFALGWTPCIGPILGTVLTLAAYEATAAKGALLLLVYGVGAAIPLLVFALLVDRIRTLAPRLLAYERRVRAVTGVVLVVIGILLALNMHSQFSAWILRTVPNWVPAIA